MSKLKPSMLKTLILDVECAPKLAHVWGLWNQNIGLKQLVHDTYILNWSAKWLGDEYIYSDSLHYHTKAYKQDPTNDKEIMQSVWEMMDEADVIIGHNGDRFDIPLLNSRFLVHGMQPPSSFRTIDTLKIAKRNFKMTSNKLEFLARTLGLGGKMDTGGFDLWSNIVLHQCKESFDHMVEYCEQDVLLLEAVYMALRPWDNKHPTQLYICEQDNKECNICQGAVVLNGSYSTNTQIYQKYKCKECGHNMRSTQPTTRDKGQKKNELKSI